MQASLQKIISLRLEFSCFLKSTIFFLSFALYSIFGVSQSWTRYRNEVSAGIGITNFLGDLGGGKNIGKPGIVDLNYQSTRPMISVTAKSLLAPHIAVRGNLLFGMLSGNDKYAKQIHRNNRNLHFRSILAEIAGLIEIHPLKERSIRVRWKRTRSRSELKYISPYGFVGIGAFFFNPKGKYLRKWHALQPLGTEGQGVGGPEPYSRIAFTTPFGIGIKYGIDKYLSFGFEFGLRFTNTDYIDDVSGVYHEKDEISSQKGDIAAHFADPSLGKIVGGYPAGGHTAGIKRGDPTNNDSYGVFRVYISQRLTKGKSFLPKF